LDVHPYTESYHKEDSDYDHCVVYYFGISIAKGAGIRCLDLRHATIEFMEKVRQKRPEIGESNNVKIYQITRDELPDCVFEDGRPSWAKKKRMRTDSLTTSVSDDDYRATRKVHTNPEKEADNINMYAPIPVATRNGNVHGGNIGANGHNANGVNGDHAKNSYNDVMAVENRNTANYPNTISEAPTESNAKSPHKASTSHFPKTLGEHNSTTKNILSSFKTNDPRKKEIIKPAVEKKAVDIIKENNAVDIIKENNDSNDNKKDYDSLDEFLI